MLARFTGILILTATMIIVTLGVRFNRLENMKKRCADQNMAFDGKDYCREYTSEERAQLSQEKIRSESHKLKSFFETQLGYYKVKAQPGPPPQRRYRSHTPQTESMNQLLQIDSQAGKASLEIADPNSPSSKLWIRIDYETLEMRVGQTLLDQFEPTSPPHSSQGFAYWKWKSSSDANAQGPHITIRINHNKSEMQLSSENLNYLSNSKATEFFVSVNLKAKQNNRPALTLETPQKEPKLDSPPKRDIVPSEPTKLLALGKFEAGILGMELINQASQHSNLRHKASWSRFQQKLSLRITRRPNKSLGPQRRPAILGTTKLTIKKAGSKIIFSVRGNKTAGFPAFKVRLNSNGTQAKYKKLKSKPAQVIPFSNSWFGIWDGLCWNFEQETKFCIGILEDDSFLVQFVNDDFSAVLNY